MSVSKFLSVFGMAAGCFSIITALSIMNGFEKLIQKKLRGFHGDLRVSGIFDDYKLDYFNDSMKNSIFIERKAVLEVENQFNIMTFKAVKSENFDEIYDISYDGNSLRNSEVMIGKDLSIRLGLNIGDSIFIFSPLDQNLGFGIPIKKKFAIGSIFS